MTIATKTITTKTTITTMASFLKSSAALVDSYLIVDEDGNNATKWVPAPAGSTDLDNGRTFRRNKKGYAIQKEYEGGVRYVDKLGMRVGSDISDRFNKYISDLSEEEYGTTLFLQHGTYVGHKLDLGHTAVGLHCLAGEATLWGEQILRWGDGYGRAVKLTNINFKGYGKIDWKDSKGNLIALDDNDRRLMDNALLYGNGVLHMYGCTTQEGKGHGLVLEGWELAGKPLTNVSGSIITGRSLFQRNSGCGSYIVGNNGNGCTVELNDFRDNVKGSRDTSQVGGYNGRNLYHLNRVGGNNHMDSPACLGKVEDNYYEEDPGSAGNTYGGECRVREAAYRSGNPTIGPNVDFKDRNHPFVWRKEESGSFGLYPKDGSPRPVLQYGTEYNALKRPSTNEVRRLPAPWLNVPLLGAGGRFSYQADTLEQAQKADVFYQTGEELVLRAPSAEGQRYEVASGGNGGRQLEGLFGGTSPGSGGQLILEGNRDQLHPGDYLEVTTYDDKDQPSQVVIQVLKVEYDQNNGWLAITDQYNRISGRCPGQPLRYATPEFRPLPT